MAIAEAETTTKRRLSLKPSRRFVPRMWQGCNLGAWLRLLVRNRLRVHWRYWYIAVIATFVCSIHSVLRGVQWLLYSRIIGRNKLIRPPIFILGHWRTGTTLLHELLVLDPQHTCPTSYECFAPNHFLLSESLATKLLWFLAPSQRPMDNMAAGWDRPQEDEFALCMLGQPSPYLTIAFPNHGPAFDEYLDLEGLPPRALERWKRTLRVFLQTITVRRPKRLVLKSPPHTCRIKVLKEMFPDAIFIHIVRNPYVVFPSTMNLWKSLYLKQGLQVPNFEGLEDYVFKTFLKMHAKLDEARQLVREDHFYELRYEDLIRDPEGEIRALYEHLNLGDFETVRPRLEDYLASVAGYETNRYELTPWQREMISRRWGPIIERYGYREKRRRAA